MIDGIVLTKFDTIDDKVRSWTPLSSSRAAGSARGAARALQMFDYPGAPCVNGAQSVDAL
jgi:hypothetical protein